ncbi:hypothetical protein CEUSTIGMA_g8325.t1 [Chlamydomonas eustigma]|uniref:Major facilitator superfamily (MFS) profile domain-containing protein n=1 Tax=Chlamydomonas eustigma TaxID=1157962 RepID=A0A250XDQ1_9CHLO|nr:hypothetical protein CEUSTIGMA_g8325.t1 [Chlamydomonas eustigma]|eukprot:GAX80890.1 hypothetical protein CEUSTIGMA_g8325.t1 [Chlamydomonas eustigma]
MLSGHDEKLVPPPFLAAAAGHEVLTSHKQSTIFSTAEVNLALSNTTTVIRLFFYAILAACGGFLLGYDNGVMGGVSSSNAYLQLFFPEVMSSKMSGSGSVYCVYNDHILSLVTSSLFLSAAPSALLGGYLCNKHGRKAVLMASGLAFLIGTAMVASSFSVIQLVLGRLLLGVGVGLSTMATPMYLTEIAPYKWRGRLNICFQLFITIGIFGAQGLNLGLLSIADYGWRISLALGAVPALLIILGCILLPDTPTSLIARGQDARAKAVLGYLRGTSQKKEADTVFSSEVNEEFEILKNSVENTLSSQRGSFCALFTRLRCRPHMFMCCLLPFFQQFTGINAIMFFGPQLFQAAGQGDRASLLSCVIIGSVNVGSTFLALWLADLCGRKRLFFAGAVQMLLTLGVVAGLIQLIKTQYAGNTRIAAAIIALICLFVSGFAYSWGPLAWLVPSELANESTRSAGMGLTTFTNFFFTFVIGQAFLPMMCSMEWGVYLFFAGFVIIMSLYVQCTLPETMGIATEEVEGLICGSWPWRMWCNEKLEDQGVETIAVKPCV